MESYFNTTNETGRQLEKSIDKAENQEAIILNLFKKNISMSPSQVYSYFDSSTPITSIRRAITVLTDHGLLVKTDRMVFGMYGKKEHIYELIQKVTLEELLDGFKSDLLMELIEIYLQSGWHMFNYNNFASRYSESDLIELIKRKYIRTPQGINGPVIELLNHERYRSVLK